MTPTTHQHVAESILLGNHYRTAASVEDELCIPALPTATIATTTNQTPQAPKLANHHTRPARPCLAAVCFLRGLMRSCSMLFALPRVLNVWKRCVSKSTPCVNAPFLKLLISPARSSISNIHKLPMLQTLKPVWFLGGLS